MFYFIISRSVALVLLLSGVVELIDNSTGAVMRDQPNDSVG